MGLMDESPRNLPTFGNMKITRRTSTIGLLASTAVSAFPKLATTEGYELTEPPVLRNVEWVRREPDTKSVAFNLRTAKVPNLRAFCFNEEGVQRALGWALENEVPFSIQSGGHCFEGFSQNHDLIIDLSKMSSTNIASDGILMAEPGARLWQVNDETASSGRAIPAGYCQYVALGGHVAGGGIGILSRLHGLTSDNLLSARLVTADGKVIEASETANPDLYWALRGGGSGSFGVVTSFKLNTHPVSRAALSDHYWILEQEYVAQFLKDAQDLSGNLPDDVSPYFYFTTQSDRKVFVRLRLVSFQSTQDVRTITKKFDGLAQPLIETTQSSGTYTEISDLMWPRNHNQANWIKNKSLFLDQNTDHKLWQDLVQTLIAHQEHGIWFSMEQLGGTINKLNRDQTAFPHRTAQILVQFSVALTDSSKASSALAALDKAFRSLLPGARAGTYVNYPDTDLKYWQQAYWGINFERLVRIKRKYDPKNVFRHAQSVPTEIST